MLLLGCVGAVAEDVVYPQVTIKADTASSSIMLPRGVASVENDHTFIDAVTKLFKTLDNSGCELLRVIVSGSASPDGLWGNNIALSKARTDNAARFVSKVMGVPAYKIEKKDLMEDWSGLQEMVRESELPHKEEVLEIIRTKTWGERKTALRQMYGGSVWAILEDHYFPLMRCVKISLVFKGELKQPAEKAPVPMESTKPQVDTVYVRDTVYVMREIIRETGSSCPEMDETYSTAYERKVWDTPWMMGVKTNLAYDAVAMPSFGIEVQLARHLSLDLQGWGTWYNMFVPSDENARFVGVSPELRWWFGDDMMKKGSFIGLHGNLAWFRMQWKNGMLYQNGPKSIVDGDFDAALSPEPVWSAGVTYGYSLGFGRSKAWGVEFVIGAGYMALKQNVAELDPLGQWQLKEHQNINGFGITKLGVNLTYRFSLRRWEPEIRFAY